MNYIQFKHISLNNLIFWVQAHHLTPPPKERRVPSDLIRWASPSWCSRLDWVVGPQHTAWSAPGYTAASPPSSTCESRHSWQTCRCRKHGSEHPRETRGWILSLHKYKQILRWTHARLEKRSGSQSWRRAAQGGETKWGGGDGHLSSCYLIIW